ncbi:MAG: ABC transporter ATP-binding protein [bacterium]
MSILKLEGLRKEYKTFLGGKKTIAVDNIDLEVQRGEILGFLGPNGAGKTTTIKMICGLVNPTRGQVLIDGDDINKERKKAMGKIGVLLEGSRNIYWRLTPYENLRYFGNVRGMRTKQIKTRIDELLYFFSLDERKNELTQKLSRGMQQKVAISVALVTNPQLLLLDEPVVGLDPHSSKELQERIIKIAKEEGKTIIIATHQMDVAQRICDRIAIINKGKIIVCDTVKNLLNFLEAQHYEFRIKGTLSREAKDKLSKISYLEENIDGTDTQLSINLTHPNLLYEIINILKSENLNIIKISKEDVNLEKLYFQMVPEKDEKFFVTS